MAPKTTILTRTREMFSVLRAAGAAASALEGFQRPRARDLETLGIDPQAFSRIVR